MKTYTLIKSRKGNKTDIEGTLPELIQYFSYTLECGNSYNRKIPLQPKSIKGLVKAVNMSYDETGEYRNYIEVA